MEETLELLKAYIKKNHLQGLTYINTFDDGSGGVYMLRLDGEDSHVFSFGSIEALEDELTKD